MVSMATVCGRYVLNFPKALKLTAILFSVGLTQAAMGGEPGTLQLTFDKTQGPVAHGAHQLRVQLEAAGWTIGEQGAASVRIELENVMTEGEGEHFSILRVDENRLVIRGGGPTGAMYGALAVAEDLRNGVALHKVPERTEKARLPFRAIKFNLPWMSYRKGESLQLHQDTVRDLEYWEAFLDQMAENRFNVLSLWGLHPFTLMIRPTNFPEASGFNDEELAEWQHFWRTLFRMAKDRAIETYIVNWNIFVSPEFAKAHNIAQYSIDWNYSGEGDTSDLVKRYTREVVTQVIDEYEDLTGLGFTLAERMVGMTPKERQQWILDTFYQGIKDADRDVKLIHRAPLEAGRHHGGSTDRRVELLTRDSIEQMDLPVPIWVELKFNWSHAYSSPHLIHVHGGPLTDAYWNPPPKNYKMTWMVRNEDIFVLRWGEPDFIRRHLKLNSQPYVGGYFVGSETYIPGKDYFTKPDSRINWKYAFERQWLLYKAWGRLLYDPETTDEVFEAEFRRRYGSDGDKLFRAMVLGSRMPLRLGSLFKGTWDLTLYSEGFLAPFSPHGRSGDQALITVNQLIDHPVLDPNYISIEDFVTARFAGKTFGQGKVTPQILADELERDGREALGLLEGVTTDGPAHFEVSDIRAWAHLSLYFAEKLRGAVALRKFREGKDAQQQTRAIAHLERAVDCWKDLIEVTAPVYHKVPLPHLANYKDGRFHWSRFLSEVKRDVEIAKSAE